MVHFNKPKTITLILLVFIFFNKSIAQELENKKISSVKNPITIKAFFEELENEFNIRFFYKEEWFGGVTVDNSINGKTIKEAMNEITRINILEIDYRDPYIIFYKSEQSILRIMRRLKAQVKII